MTSTDAGGALGMARQHLSGIKIVDADTHVSEWPDLWTSRASPKYRPLVPQMRQVDGEAVWMLGEHVLSRSASFCAIDRHGMKAKGTGFRRMDLQATHPGSYDVRARLAHMDAEGVWAQIAYTNLLGFGGQRSMLVEDDLRIVSTRILNDAMAEMQADSGQRIFPMIMTPWWDIKLALAEVERCADMGMRGVNMNSDPQNHGLPHLGERYWDPLWELCAARGLPINFHIGASDESMTWRGSGLWAGHPDNIELAYGSLMLFVGNLRVLVNILLSRFLERHPTLKVVSVESGAGWIPFMLEGLEYQLEEAGEDIPVRDVFSRQIYACSWFERRDIVKTMRTIGADRLMFETDFPHPTCLYPDAVDYLTPAVAEMTPEERRMVFGATAAKVYGLPI